MRAPLGFADVVQFNAWAAGYFRVPVALIVAQAALETGWFGSAIYRENANAFGLRLPVQRPTTAIGEARGHAVFPSVSASVRDYFLRQRYFGIPDGDAAQYVAVTVASGYATAPNYAAAWLALYDGPGLRPGVPGLVVAGALAYLGHHVQKFPSV